VLLGVLRPQLPGFSATITIIKGGAQYMENMGVIRIVQRELLI